ncbi:mobilization protein [Shigella flexneri]|nr:mobilization protein [Shigella flexneri]
MVKLAGNTCMMLLGMVIFLFTVSGGTLWYLCGMIQANLEGIRKQNESLEKLNAKTWGGRYHEGSNARVLVVPGGIKAETIWTLENGKQNTVRRVQG